MSQPVALSQPLPRTTLQASYHADPALLVTALVDQVTHLPPTPGLTPWQLQEATLGHVTLTADLLVGVPGLPTEFTVKINGHGMTATVSHTCANAAEGRLHLFQALTCLLDTRLGRMN